MKACKRMLFLAGGLWLTAMAAAQPVLTKPRLSFSNDSLVILYDIRNCEGNARFTIEPHIRLAGGAIPNIQSISGDVGENIPCGMGKKIVWNLAADGVEIDDELEIQLYAYPLEEPGPDGEEEKPILKEPEVDTLSREADENTERKTEMPGEGSGRTYSRTNLMVSSFFVPGLGQKKVKQKASPLIMSVLGYGSLAVSGYYLLDYQKTYDQYLEATNRTDSDRLFKESEESYDMAKYLALGAAGVWTVNLIWLAVIKPKAPANLQAGVSPVAGQGIQVYARWSF